MPALRQHVLALPGNPLGDARKFPPSDSDSPAILMRQKQSQPQRQEWQIVQSQLDLRDLLP